MRVSMGALCDSVSVLCWILHVIGFCFAFVAADSRRQVLFVMSTCRSHAIGPYFYDSLLFYYTVDVENVSDHFIMIRWKRNILMYIDTYFLWQHCEETEVCLPSLNFFTRNHFRILYAYGCLHSYIFLRLFFLVSSFVAVYRLVSSEKWKHYTAVLLVTESSELYLTYTTFRSCCTL